MSVPLPRPRALWLVLALVVAVLDVVTGAMADAARSTRRPTIRPATPCSASTAPPTARPAAGTFATGGVGLAGLGGRQGAVELSDDGRNLYAVNAGSEQRLGRSA